MAGRVPSIQGRQYSNRKDLQQSPRRKQPKSPPASGVGIPGAAQREIMADVQAQVAPPPQQGQGPNPDSFAMESVPNMDDPTSRPNVPINAGLQTQTRSGLEVPPAIQRLQAAYKRNPNPELADLLDRYWKRRDSREESMGSTMPPWELPGGQAAWTTVF